MREVSTDYLALSADAEQKHCFRVDCNGASYPPQEGEDGGARFTMRRSAQIFSDGGLRVGGCVSAQAETEIELNGTTVPRGARFDVWSRFVGGDKIIAQGATRSFYIGRAGSAVTVFRSRHLKWVGIHRPGAPDFDLLDPEEVRVSDPAAAMAELRGWYWRFESGVIGYTIYSSISEAWEDESTHRLYVRAAEMRTRLNEWIPLGYYYVSERSVSRGNESRVTLIGNDELRRADTQYATSPDIGEWPRSMTDVVAEICGRLGIVLRSGVTINPYPINYTDTMTMREVLGYIAAAHGGSWRMRYHAASGVQIGELDLVRLVTPESADIDIGHSYAGLAQMPSPPAVSRISVMMTDTEYCTAGDDSGYDLSFSIPIIDAPTAQDIADDLLAEVGGYVYRPFSCDTVWHDLRMEVGDTVTFGDDPDVYTVVSLDESLSALPAAGLAADGGDEVSDEFPFQDPVVREFKRKLTETQTALTVRLGEIKALVAGLAEPWESRAYHKGDIVLHDDHFYRCTVSESDTEWVPDEWEEVSEGVIESIIELAVGKMTLGVTSPSGAGSTITLTLGSVEVASAAAYFDVDEAHFRGTLSADKVSAGVLDAGDIELGGAFKVYATVGGEKTLIAEIGAAEGQDAQGRTTYGASMKSADGNSYAIVTNAGVRVQSGNNRLVITANSGTFNGVPLGTALFG